WKPVLYVNDEQIESDLFLCPPRRAHDTVSKPKCPIIAPNLESNYPIASKVDHALLSRLSELYTIKEGGTHTPSHCRPNFNVAIIVAYRDRPSQLNLFLQHMHPFLNGQLISYTIFIIEQNEKHLFNRGKLFNIGFKEALKRDDSFCCFIFHDIDLLPENQHNIYACSSQPRHMSANVDKLRYVLLYPKLFGGAIAMRKEHFEKVNGFGNTFFGWGGEDDNLSKRVYESGLEIVRFESHLSRYKMLSHEPQQKNPDRFKLVKKEEKNEDGLSTLNYKVISVSYLPLYTKITVDVDPS
ncbi:beta-1:4-N-acetylgalactosaminyltransferase bre-4-like protein, partial [Dinothrombium tinctorium]